MSAKPTFTCAGITLARPTLLGVVIFLFHCVVIFGSFWVLGDKLDRGEIANEPELLRRLYFSGFSLGLCTHFCRELDFWKNSWENRITVFIGVYLPIGWFGAYLIGILRY